VVQIKSYTSRNKSELSLVLVFALTLSGGVKDFRRLLRLGYEGTVGSGVCWVSVLSMSMLCLVTMETSIPCVIHYETPGT
jgi:hypothetical protein